MNGYCFIDFEGKHFDIDAIQQLKGINRRRFVAKESIACSDLYAKLVVGLTSGGFFFFARQGF